MRRFGIIALILAAALQLAPVLAFVRGGYATNVSAPTFNGFLDQFSAQAATEYWSCAWKSTNAYSSSCGVVTRDDGTTQTINFLSNGAGDAATFTTFCAGHSCFLSSWTGQVNGVTATQATLANMPRAIINANGNIAICPQPKSFMTTSFSSSVNTAKVHLFAVAKPGLADNRYHQPDMATTVVTANVTSGSTGITSMSSQVGLSTANGQPNNNFEPGITDSGGHLPDAQSNAGTFGETFLSALPTGSTGTLGFNPGGTTPTGSQTGDTLTFTNAMALGPWIFNGPTGTNWASNSYWGFGMGSSNDLEPADVEAARNATTYLQMSSVASNGLRGQWGVWDFDTSTRQMNFNGVNMTNAQGSATNVTYSTNVGLTFFGNNSGNGALGEQLSGSCFETMALFPATEASRVTMAQFLMAQDAISFPFATATSDGFTMTGIYSASDYGDGAGLPNSVYGTNSFTDLNGVTWDSLQSGGYVYPSLAYANNINNTASLIRFILQSPGDSDMNITQHPRTEALASLAKVLGGQSFSEFAQLQFESLPAFTSVSDTWCFTLQDHYSNTRASNSGTNAAPDLVTATCSGNKLQFVTQQCSGCSGNPTNISCGTAQTIVTGTTYAVVITGFWSNTQTTDTLQISFGPNGGTLTPLCNLGPGSLYQIDDFAQMKQGLYTGDVNNQIGGTAILRVMNAQFSATANAFSSFITSQPALPTHP